MQTYTTCDQRDLCIFYRACSSLYSLAYIYRLAPDLSWRIFFWRLGRLKKIPAWDAWNKHCHDVWPTGTVRVASWKVPMFTHSRWLHTTGSRTSCDEAVTAANTRTGSVKPTHIHTRDSLSQQTTLHWKNIRISMDFCGKFSTKF